MRTHVIRSGVQAFVIVVAGCFALSAIGGALWFIAWIFSEFGMAWGLGAVLFVAFLIVWMAVYEDGE